MTHLKFEYTLKIMIVKLKEAIIRFDYKHQHLLFPFMFKVLDFTVLNEFCSPFVQKKQMIFYYKYNLLWTVI